MNKINFSKDDSVENNIPYQIGGELYFGHINRHGQLVGKEPASGYTAVASRLTGKFLQFGHPNSAELPVVRFKEPYYDELYGRFQYSAADIKLYDGTLFTIKKAKNSYWSAVVAESDLTDEMRQVVAEKTRLEEEHWAKKRSEEIKRQNAVKIERKLTRVERRWIKRFVQSGGYKSAQQVVHLMESMGWQSHEISVSEVREKFGGNNV